MFKQFGIEKPIIQAPMAGVTTPKFIAACCEAGVLGFIGAGYLDGQETRAFIHEARKLTTKPFGVNLFVQEEPRIDTQVLQQARAALQPIYDELGIEGAASVVSRDLYSEQVEVLLTEKIPIVSFTFGLPSEEVIGRFKANGAFLIGTATTKAEALAVEAAGLDAVVLQGIEAGGHRGSFHTPFEHISLFDLLQQVKGALSIPVIATGGIMTREHVQQAMDNGAAAVQIGTALLVAEECEVNAYHKEAVLHAHGSETVLTTAFTGKPARGLKNTFTERLKEEVVAPYPLQHHLTAKIRKASMVQGRPEYLSLWMGQNSHLAKQGTVRQIISTLS